MAVARILAVDDHPVNLKLVLALLSTESYDVRTAADAEQAQAQVAAFRPHLILMDLQLPDLDGFELTRRLKAERATSHIIIIAMTSYAMKGDEERALAAGCDGYLSKPLDTRTLPDIIAGYLARTRSAP